MVFISSAFMESFLPPLCSVQIPVPPAPNLVKIDKEEGDEREGFLRSHDKEENKENIQQNS